MTGRKSRYITTALAAALAVSLTACGGGGQGASPLPSSTSGPQTPTTAKSASAQMVITIPAKTTSTSSVRTQYISASTQSVTVGLLSGTTTTPLAEADLTPSSPNCAPVTGGGTKCTVSLVATAGTQTFVMKMYDQTGGKGNLLSTGNVAATLTAGQSTTVPVVLDGVVSTVSLVLGTSTLPVGTAGSTSVTVQAVDAGGNIIVGPGGFSTPVTLAITGDTYNTLSLSAKSVNSPGQVVTLAYNGGTNVGSTITPSNGSTVGTAASFAGSGAAITEIAPTIVAPSYFNNWLYPADVAALPNGKVAALFDTYRQTYTGSGWAYTFAYALGIGSTSGFQNYYVGDTTDPFNKSTATSYFAGQSGVTVVKGMSLNIVPWPNPPVGTNYSYNNSQQEHTLSSDSQGNLYYAATFSSTAAPTCTTGTLSSGVIGVLNTTAGTTNEIVLKGVPQYMQTDSSGNAWFVEQSGTCNGTNLLASGWGIGELKAGSSTPTETDFASAGIASNANPYAMNITPDGSSMFIADNANGTIIKVATAAMTSTTATLQNTYDADALAAGPDGTAYWMSQNSGANNDYYYGYAQGSQTFGSTPVHEALFPVAQYYGYDAVYADGSFWGAGYYADGIGRTSGLSTGAPQIQLYSTQAADYAEPVSLAAGSGYIWANDDDYDAVLALQYGAQSSATMTINAVHRVGNINMTKLPSVKQMRTMNTSKS